MIVLTKVLNNAWLTRVIWVRNSSSWAKDSTEVCNLRRKSAGTGENLQNMSPCCRSISRGISKLFYMPVCLLLCQENLCTLPFLSVEKKFSTCLSSQIALLVQHKSTEKCHVEVAGALLKHCIKLFQFLCSCLGPWWLWRLCAMMAICWPGKASPRVATMRWVNIAIAASILFTGGSPTQSLHLLQNAGIACFTPRTYYCLQQDFMIPAVSKVLNIAVRVCLVGQLKTSGNWKKQEEERGPLTSWQIKAAVVVSAITRNVWVHVSWWNIRIHNYSDQCFSFMASSVYQGIKSDIVGCTETGEPLYN